LLLLLLLLLLEMKNLPQSTADSDTRTLKLFQREQSKPTDTHSTLSTPESKQYNAIQRQQSTFVSTI